MFGVARCGYFTFTARRQHTLPHRGEGASCCVYGREKNNVSSGKDGGSGSSRAARFSVSLCCSGRLSCQRCDGGVCHHAGSIRAICQDGLTHPCDSWEVLFTQRDCFQGFCLPFTCLYTLSGRAGRDRCSLTTAAHLHMAATLMSYTVPFGIQ